MRPLPHLLLPLGLLLSVPFGARPALGARPNILFVLTDDMRADDLEYMPRVRELLVERGTRFESFLVNVSLCCPSRATYLTGRYSHNTGIYTNSEPGGGFGKAVRTGLEQATVATALHAAGYRTGYFGKYLNGYPGKSGSLLGPYVPPGWDTWQVPLSGDPYAGYGYTLLETLGPESPFAFPVYYDRRPANYITDVLVGKLREFVAGSAAAGVPFYAVLAPYAPH